jgi:hypothetical protein
LKSVAWPVVTSVGVYSDSRFEESRIPRVTRNCVTFEVTFLTS